MKVKNTENLWYTAPLLFLAAALLPEYIAPVMMLVCFILVLKNIIKTKKIPSLGSGSVSLAVYYFWMLVGAFYSSGIITSLASLGLWLLMFTAFFYFSEVLDSEEKIEKTFLMGSVSSGVAGGIGIVQMILYHYGEYIHTGFSKLFNPFWHFLDVIIAKLVVVLPDFIASSLPRKQFVVFPTRACSTFTNPLFFAAFEVMMLPFSAYCFLCGKDKKTRVIGFLCFALSIGGIASSYSRGPYIAMAAVLVILLFYGGRRTLKLGAVGLGAFAVLACFAQGTVKRIFTLLISTSAANDISINTRTKIWKAVAEVISEKPIFGYGTGFNNIRQILHNVYLIKQPHAHNIFLEIWVENGVIGLLIFAALLLVFTINSIKLYKKRHKQRRYAVTLFAAVAGFVLCGMTDCLFYGLKPLQYFMMIFGISQAVFRLFLGEEEFFLVPKSVINRIFKKK